MEKVYIDIHVINVFLYQTLIAVPEYLILVLFYENRNCCMRSDWKRRDGACRRGKYDDMAGDIPLLHLSFRLGI